MPDHEIDVAVADARWAVNIPDLDGLAVRAVAAALFVLPDSTTGPCEISVLLADDAAVRDLNRTWRGQDKPTNVLSFPAADGPRPPGTARPLGDVVVAYETMLRESDAQSKPLADHLAHLLVHGTLHLLGQDHETGEPDADAMEALEVAALATLGVPNPYDD